MPFDIARRGRERCVEAMRGDQWRLATMLFLFLAIVHTWPLATNLAHLSFIHDDEWLNAWAVAWIARQLPRDPMHLFDANIFYPHCRALIYTEPVIVPGLLAAPIHWLGGSALLAHNVLVLAGLTFTALAMYWLVRAWTDDYQAGLLSGMLFAFSAPFITRIAHVQALHAYWLPLAFLAFHRLITHGRARYAAWLGLCVIGAALTSGYLVVFVFFGLAAAALARIPSFVRREGVRRLVRLGVASAGTAVILFVVLRPYLEAGHRRPPVAETTEITTALSSYLASAAALHYNTWSGSYYHTAPGTLFPGMVALVMAGAAIFHWRCAAPGGIRRMLLLVAGVGVVLSLGSLTPFYSWAYKVVPPLQGLRAIHRFGILVVFALAVLAGIGLSACLRSASSRRRMLVTCTLFVLATGESFHGPLSYSRYDYAGRIHRLLANSSWPGAVLELPIYQLHEFHRNARYLLASTVHWRSLVNGFGGFAPPNFNDTARVAGAFPSVLAVAWLQEIGVGYVVVHLDAYPEPTRLLQKLTRFDQRRDLVLEAAEGATRLYRIQAAKARAIEALEPAARLLRLRFAGDLGMRGARAFGFQSLDRFIGYVESSSEPDAFVMLRLPVPMSGHWLDASTGAVLQLLTVKASTVGEPPVRVMVPTGHEELLLDLKAFESATGGA